MVVAGWFPASVRSRPMFLHIADFFDAEGDEDDEWDENHSTHKDASEDWGPVHQSPPPPPSPPLLLSLTSVSAGVAVEVAANPPATATELPLSLPRRWGRVEPVRLIRIAFLMPMKANEPATSRMMTNAIPPAGMSMSIRNLLPSSMASRDSASITPQCTVPIAPVRVSGLPPPIQRVGKVRLASQAGGCYTGGSHISSTHPVWSNLS